jgi:hypothetical protein
VYWLTYQIIAGVPKLKSSEDEEDIKKMQNLHQCIELLFRYGYDEDEVDLK